MKKKFPGASAPEYWGKTRSFSLPQELVDDPSLSISEKRSILSEWVSDASAIVGYPALRWLSGTNFPVTFASIVNAREQLDRLAAEKEENIDLSCGKELHRVIVADFARRKIAQGDDGR